jgi:hypothetical protein
MRATEWGIVSIAVLAAGLFIVRTSAGSFGPLTVAAWIVAGICGIWLLSRRR